MKKIFSFLVLSIIVFTASAQHIRCEKDVKADLAEARAMLEVAQDAFSKGIEGSEATYLYYKNKVENLEEELQSAPTCSSAVSSLKASYPESSYSGLEGSYVANRKSRDDYDNEISRHNSH